MRHAAMWEFPGGKVEAGESDEDCLHRELTEELDMRVIIKKRLPHIIHHYPDFTIELVPFLCAVEKLVYNPVEHQEIAWLTRDEMGEMIWSPADIGLMEYIRDHLLTQH